MRFGFRSTIPLLTLTLLAGCTSGTRITSSWVNEEIQGPLKFQKVLALIVSRDPEVRRELEGELSVIVRRTNVVPAYLAVTDEMLLDVDRTRAALTESGYDGAVVVRFVSSSQSTMWISPYYDTFWNYYGYAWNTVMSPGYTITDTKVYLETRIYDLRSGRQVWAGISESFNPSDADDLLVRTAEAVGRELVRTGLVQ